MPKCILTEQDLSNSPILQSIEITNPPNKTSYLAGETFDTTGMVVTANYTINSVAAIATEVKNYAISPAILSDGVTSITVAYSEGGITSIARQNITVNRRLAKIEITTNPSKTSYEYGDTLLTDGMVVTATYSDGTTAAITGYSYSPAVLDTVTNNQPIMVVYTENGVTQTVIFDVEVNRKTVAKPVWKLNLTYNDNIQSVNNTSVWNNYNPEYMTISGITSATNAGTYMAIFTPKENYCWEDNSIISQDISWTIDKAAGSLTLSKSDITLNFTTKSDTFIITRAGNGEITVESSDTNIATVSLNDNTVTVRSVNDKTGTATITVKVMAGTNHTAPANKICSVSCKFLPDAGKALNSYTWDEISNISRRGLASNYFSIGDEKAVILHGTVGNLALNGTYYCYIIGFDHNTETEGTNLIHFQFGCTGLSNGKRLAFVDSGYGSDKTSGAWFNMNNIRNNSGGWENSSMRAVICPAFKNAMPSDLRAVLKTVTKYSDNTGGGSNIASYVTATLEEVFLLAEFEVFGTRTTSNKGEYNYQAQYAWYSAGNSKIKYRHNAINSTAEWWLRSVDTDTSKFFCAVSTSGDQTYSSANYSFGFAPAFCV